MKTIVRRIGLVAHDAMKKDMIEWVLWNSERLIGHKFYCTGTTGTLIKKALEEKKAHEDDELMADLMPTKENTDILPALEPLPDTTNVIDHLDAPITDTSILELPDDTTTKVSLDMLNEIEDDDLETDESFAPDKKNKYLKLIIVLIVLLIIGASILILKIFEVF